MPIVTECRLNYLEKVEKTAFQVLQSTKDPVVTSMLVAALYPSELALLKYENEQLKAKLAELEVNTLKVYKGELLNYDDLPDDKDELRKMGFGLWDKLGNDTNDDDKMRNAMSRVLGYAVASRKYVTVSDWKKWILHCDRKLKGN